jgi:phosphoribosylaminoimidazolecarboxamide formyltransferase/IMP cyclohydrolase
MEAEEILAEDENMTEAVVIRRALVSVYDKSGLEVLAEILQRLSISVLSTGKTLEVLGKLGVSVQSVAEYTGSEEILDGRVKTLHPKLFAGILARRDKEEHSTTMKKQRWGGIDLVVVNLYPFEATVSKPGATEEEAIENIDIGGPSLLRAAAKNFQSVTDITSPEEYESLGKELKTNGGATSLEFRKECARKVFALTSRYDRLITGYLSQQEQAEREELPPAIRLELFKKQDLRYGENPHQKGALYSAGDGWGVDSLEILGGKELSYNNLRDLNAALKLAAEFDVPFAGILKHTNPCGAAVGKTLAEAYRDAYDCDPLSAYGGIVGLNQKVDLETAKLLEGSPFLECILAPDYEREALEILLQKKNRRIVACRNWKSRGSALRLYHLEGGFLAETADNIASTEDDLRVVSKKKPTEMEIEGLLFAERIAKHTHSNAIVLASGTKTIGIAGGITSRVDAVWLALHKAEKRAKGSVLASDAFFPMPDGVEKAAAGGVVSVLAPSGSKKDAEVIAAADKLGIALVFSNHRHFRH